MSTEYQFLKMLCKRIVIVGGSPYRPDSSIGPDVSFTVDQDGNRSIRLTGTPEKKHREHVSVCSKR